MKVNIQQLRSEKEPDPFEPSPKSTAQSVGGLMANKELIESSEAGISYVASSKDATDLFEMWGLNMSLPTKEEGVRIYGLGKTHISKAAHILYNEVEIRLIGENHEEFQIILRLNMKRKP